LLVPIYVLLVAGYLLLLLYLLLQSFGRQRIIRFFDSLIVNFRKSSDLIGPEAEIQVDSIYTIGGRSRDDFLQTEYQLTAIGSPVRAKHIFLGTTQYSSPGSNLQALASMAPKIRLLEAHTQAGDVLVTTPSIMPYRTESNRLYLCVTFSPAIPVGATAVIQLALRRPGIWDMLRRRGSDEGGYVVSALPPRSVTLRFRPPPRIPLEDLSIGPADSISEGAIAISRNENELVLHIENPSAGTRYGYIVTCSALRSWTARLRALLPS